MSQLFWKGKKVLITGHTGFKGGWLTLWMKHLDANIIGVSLEPPTNPNIYEKANVGEGILSLREDIRNGDAIKKIFQEQKPEIVFHLAAQPLVRYSYREPAETYETNVMGSVNVLEGIRSINTVRAVVMVTTDKCYENKEWEWGYRENEPMGGHDPYSSSKGATELLIASYRNSFFPSHLYEDHKTAIASARAGNVIGGGDWAEDRLIPDIIRSFRKGAPILIRSPDSIRPWQHVLEPLSGYMLLAEKLYEEGSQYAEAWNFGPFEEDAKPVQWIVEKMIELWAQGARWYVDERECPHESNYLKLDCSKAHDRLRWYPKWDLEKALEMINLWHKIEECGGHLREATLNQIALYMKMVDRWN